MKKKNSYFVRIILSAGISIISAASASPEPEIPFHTNQGQAFLENHNIILKTATEAAAISESDAVKMASNYADKLAPLVTSVVTEYQLMPYTDFTAFSQSAKEKNARLRSNGYLNNTPVYTVTFKGLNFQSVGGSFRGGEIEHVTLHENNVVIEANSGEILFSYSYQ